MNNNARTPAFWAILVVALSAAMYGLRLCAPSDLEGYAQYRNIGYVLDVVHNGHWLTHHDLQGRILSKPPLHTWLIAASVHAFGPSRFALTLPSFLAVTTLGLLVLFVGLRQFGLLAGAFAGIAVVLSPLYSKQVAMVRSDPLFALFITAAMWAAWRAWRTGRGWTLFWFFGALGTLTKGPLALLLAGIGLLAWLWERRTVPATPRPQGAQGTGIIVFFAVCLAWVIPALLKDGRELADMMFYNELIGQATGATNDKIPLSNFPKPTLNLLSRFAPFSLLAFYGIWRVFRAPEANAAERCFERFLVCAALGGLLVFSLAAHFRSDLILPLWAPCALLAGREAARLTATMGKVRFASLLTVLIAGLFAFAWWTYHPTSGARLGVVALSEEVKAAAGALRGTGIPAEEIMHIGTPSTLQFYLGTARAWTTPEAMRQVAADGHPPLWLAVGSSTAKVDAAELGAASATEVFRWPARPSEPPVVRVYQLAW